MPINPDLDLSRPFEEEEPEELRSLLQDIPYRPTIYLGLGGTGTAAVSRVKELFRQLYSPMTRTGEARIPEIPGMYAFRAFDTNINEHRTNLVRDAEWIHLGVDNMAEFYEGSGKDPMFREWVIKGYPATDITAGCAGLRNLGRLCFFHNANTVHAALSQVAAQVNAGYVQITNPTPIVYLFSSLSGGTGSGMFLDMCFLLRQLLPSAHITGIIAALEGLATRNVTQGFRKQVLINTFGGLKELDYFMSLGQSENGEGQTIQYPYNVTGRMVKPFNECHLMTARKSDGTLSLPSASHVTAFMARMAFMMSAYAYRTNSTPDYAGVMVDLLPQTANYTPGGSKVAYFVPGLVQVHFPISRVAHWVALDTAINYLRYQAEGSGEAGDEEARSFVQDHQLGYLSLRDRIARDPKSEKSLPLPPRSYEDDVRALIVDGDRYEARDEILGLGRKMTQSRLNELLSVLRPNVLELLQELVGGQVANGKLFRDSIIGREIASLLASEKHRSVGALDFVVDLCTVLRAELELLQKEEKATIEGEFQSLERQWRDIEPFIDDICTKSGPIDQITDWAQRERGSAQMALYLNQAESVILAKARNELVRETISQLISLVDDLVASLRDLIRTDVPHAIEALEGRRRDIATHLYQEQEGRSSDTSNVCSHNVMTEQWKNAYVAEHCQYLAPQSVLTTLLGRQWHPIQLLEVIPGPNMTKAEALAQAVLNLVAPLTQRISELHPVGVMESVGRIHDRTPAEFLAHAFLSLLKPQMQIGAMKSSLMYDTGDVYLSGGLDDRLERALRQTEQLRNKEFWRADNLETNRINFFRFTLPIAMSGCDQIRNLFGKAYQEWYKDTMKQPKAETRQYELAKYHCFPGSLEWRDPSEEQGQTPKEMEMFARALALSVLHPVAAADLTQLNTKFPNPRDKAYGVFRVGNQQFWMCPFFEPIDPNNKAALPQSISGDLVRLGANIQEAYQAYQKDGAMRDSAERWVRWFEDSWTNFYRTTEIAERRADVIKFFDAQRAKDQDIERRNMWDRFKQSVVSWNEGW